LNPIRIQSSLSSLGPAEWFPQKRMARRRAINDVVTREYITNVHNRIHGVGFMKRAPWAFKETRKSFMKEMRTPDVSIDTRLNKAVWAKRIRNVPYHI
jgi:large subunit ribosomal protein L31e